MRCLPKLELTVAERSELIEYLGILKQEHDFPQETLDSLALLQDKLVRQNQVAHGQTPDAELLKPNGSQCAGIIAATYTSVWDGGVEVASPCKYDADERRVFAIADADVSGVESLEREYVTLPDGTELGEDDVTFDY
jgi:hypothetical protein